MGAKAENCRRKVKSAVPGGGGGDGVKAEVMLFLLFAFWPKYSQVIMLFSP